VMNCNTPDHAFYVSAQLGGYFCGDLLTIQQYGAGEGIASWLRSAGTMHFTRSRVELLNAGAGTAYGIWMKDSVVAPGEVIFERVEVDAGRNDPLVCNQHGGFFVDAPNVQLQNCTICGDFGGLWFMDNWLLPFPTGSAGAQVVNCIVAARNDSEVIGFMPLSIPSTRLDGNIYYLRPYLPNQPSFRAGYGTRVYTDFRRWRRDLRRDNASYVRNPELKNLEDGAFDPTRNSVAIDGGQLVTLLTTTDRFGRTAKHLNPASLCGIGMSAVDIGALEYEALAYTPGAEKKSRFGRPEYGLRRDGGTYVRGWNL